jgi:hypothetical protein
MSDAISGRIVRGQDPATQKIFRFEGDLDPADWDELIQRIQNLLASEPRFQGRVRLVQA